MTDLTDRYVALTSRPKGVPEAHHFEVREAAVPELAEGQILVRNSYWSVDPAMRGWVNDAPNYLPPVEIWRGHAILRGGRSRPEPPSRLRGRRDGDRHVRLAAVLGGER